jgi:fermentation-respiration switch protein FrsA (DUF1100 family)
MPAPRLTLSAVPRRRQKLPYSARVSELASQSPSPNAPYASVMRLFELRAPPLPHRWLLTDEFDSEALIGGIGVPVMILHGAADSNIPITEARRLYAAAREPKIMIEVEGAGHLDAWEGGARKSALKALVAWTAPDPRPPSTQ